MNTIEIPKHILLAAETAKQSRENFLKDHKGFTVLFITDVHTGGNDHYRQLSYAGALLDTLHVDFLVNGGDIGLDLGESKEEAERILSLTKENSHFSVPSFLCKGNHDYGTQKISNDYLNHLFNQELQDRCKENAHIVFDEEGGGYGEYYDETTKTHFLLLNTSEGDTRSYTMSAKQLAFLVDQMKKAKEEENIVLISHYCWNPCGAWTSYPPNTNEPWYCAATNIERDFVARKAGSEPRLNLSWDFSKVPSSAKFLLHLCGDSHYNNTDHSHGVFTVVCQGYGGCDMKELSVGATREWIDCNTFCCFDLLVVRDDQTAKLIHVGAGGPHRDIDIQ